MEEISKLKNRYESEYCHIRYYRKRGSHIICLHIGESLDIKIDSLYLDEAVEVAKYLLRRLVLK